MLSMPAYAVGLASAALLALFTGWRYKDRRSQLWRVVIVLALNWMLGTAFVLTTGNYTPWEFNILIDALAAFAVMYHPAGRAQAYIGLFYIVQIAAHIAFGGRVILGYVTDPILYYDTLTVIAWAQLLAVGVWSGLLWGRDFVHRVRPVRHAVSGRPRLRSDRSK